jgi:hypothetical protein
MGAGQVYVLSLDDGGKAAVTTAAGKDYLHVEARPAQLMDLFAPQVAQGQQQAQMMAGMLGGQAGIDFKDAGEIVTAAFAFPRMIDRISVRMPESYETAKQANVDVELEPVANTWLGKLVGALEPTKKGVQGIGAKAAAVAVQAGVEMANLIESLRPIMAVASRVGQTDKEGRRSQEHGHHHGRHRRHGLADVRHIGQRAPHDQRPAGLRQDGGSAAGRGVPPDAEEGRRVR